jgi:hypothetical protein
MISLTKSKVSSAQISALCQFHFNSTLQTCKELNDGFYNISYLIRLADDREVLLKIAPPKDVEILTYEKAIMKSEVAFFKRPRLHTDIALAKIRFVG